MIEVENLKLNMTKSVEYNPEEKEGNIFFIPLFLPFNIKEITKSYRAYKFDKSLDYAFARIIELDKSGGNIIEIFNYTGPIPSDSQIVLQSGLMFRPLHVSVLFNKKRWRVIFESSFYN